MPRRSREHQPKWASGLGDDSLPSSERVHRKLREMILAGSCRHKSNETIPAGAPQGAKIMVIDMPEKPEQASEMSMKVGALLR